MAVPQEKLFIGVAEYLRGERLAKVRHEYVDGVVYAMAGESKRHNRISGRLFNRITTHLDGTDCETYFESVKMRVSPTKFYYPDIAVICEPEAENDDYTLSYPLLIVEVLSPTTERTDRAEKLLAYQKMLTLREYAIVAQDRVFVQIHRRANDDNWTVDNYLSLDDLIEFASINLQIPLADVYRNLTFPAPETDGDFG